MSVATVDTVDVNKIKGFVLLQCLVFALLISLSPFKIASYAIPLILVAFIFIRGCSKRFYLNLLSATCIFFIVFFYYYLKSNILNYDFSIVGAVLSLLTYGSIILVLIYPKVRTSYDSPQTGGLLRFLYVVFIIETVVGLLQLLLFFVLNVTSLDESTGDVIQGTINPISFLGSSVGFNNQVFTINYIFLLMYLAPYLLSGERKYLLFIGGMVIIFASVLHVLLSFILALLTCFLLVGLIRFRKQLLRFLVISLLVLGVFIATQPKNFSLFDEKENGLLKKYLVK